MNNKNNRSYRTLMNTFYERLLSIAENIYQGRIHKISKKIGLKPYVSSLHSRVHRYPHIAKVEYKGKTVRFYAHSEIDRPTSFRNNVLDRILKNSSPDDIYFDIGAGVGSLSCVIGCHLTDGKVFAFEPLPKNIKALKRNFDENDIDGNYFEVALSNTNEKTNLNVPQNYSPGYTSAAVSPSDEISTFWNDKSKKISVQAKKGDDLIQEKQIPTPNIITIDAEGAEMDIIRGLRETISHDECRLVLVAVHEYLLNDFGTSSDELEKELQEIGFDIERFGQKSGEWQGEKRSIYRIAAHK